MPLDAKEVRRRRSSSLVYTEPPESLEQLSDQAALPNLNAEWVNAKGQRSCASIAVGAGRVAAHQLVDACPFCPPRLTRVQAPG